ncbi:MAG: glycosyltransferase 61 family protein [Methylococcaceae bacterium]
MFTKLNNVTLKSCFASPLKQRSAVDIESYPKEISFIGGIYNDLNQPYTEALLSREGTLIQAHDKTHIIDRDNAKEIENKAIYGGMLFDHYGHFLLESLARVWYIYNSTEDVYFYYPHKNNFIYNELATWQKTILRGLFSNTERIKIINEPLVFKELIIPDAGFVIKQFFAKTQAETLLLLGQNIKASNSSCAVVPDKIWLSRSLLNKGLIAGERKFELALSAEGFAIVHPETLSIEEQIELFEKASIIAGFTGSAFHTIVFAKNNHAKLLHFSRFKSPSENYPLCTKATGFNADFYNCFIRFGEIKGSWRANVLQNLNGIWEILYMQGLVQTKEYYDFALEEDLKELDAKVKLFLHI